MTAGSNPSPAAGRELLRCNRDIRLSSNLRPRFCQRRHEVIGTQGQSTLLGGARIEGVAGLVPDEAISLSLPGCRAQLAFVAWAGDHCAGLEFGSP